MLNRDKRGRGAGDDWERLNVQSGIHYIENVH